MKKLFGPLMALLVCFTACNQEESLYKADAEMKKEKDLPGVRFCGVKRSGELIELRGVARKNNLWRAGSTLKVKFLPGSPEAYKSKVETYAREWEQYADIHFEFVTDPAVKAEIRVGFDWNANHYVTWSYVGTDCKMVRSQTEPTMSFAYWEELDEEEIRAEVLRNFGMVLGLELEHRNPNFGVNWNYNKVRDYWMSQFDGEDWEEIRELVFDPFDAADVFATEYDPQSIMIWAFPLKGMVQSGSPNVEKYPNFDLSEKDIQFINQLYPKEKNSNEVIATMKTSKQEVSFIIDLLSDIEVDWGDGSKSIPEKIDGGLTYSSAFSHTYTTNEEHIIKFYGAKDVLISFSGRNNNLTDLAFLENTNLYSLDCSSNQLISLDVSRLKKLCLLQCQYNQLTSLNVSNNINLKGFSCNNNQLTDLDVSNNLQLIDSLNCSNNQISNLDLSNLPIGSVECSNNPLILDQMAITNMAQSLVDRSGKNSGYFLIDNPTAESWIKDILEAKNWKIENRVIW